MILIVDKSKKRARTYLDIFRYMGVLAYALEIKAGEKIPHERGAKFRAAVVISPEDFDSPNDLSGEIRALYGAIPVFGITFGTNSDVPFGFTKIYSDKMTSGRFLSEVQADCAKLEVPAPGVYKVAGIDASAELPNVHYFDDPLLLTRTETMILRVLLLYYPLSVSAKDVMKYAYAPTRRPEIANVRTHISVINRKFKELTGRKLITSESGVGYAILTPERMEASLAEAALLR